jgi:enolase
MKVTNTCEGIPLYEFLRLESGALKAPYVMPVPFFNVLNGGVHSGNTMAFQEIMNAPVGAASITEVVRDGRRDLSLFGEGHYEKFWGFGYVSHPKAPQIRQNMI